MSYEVTMDHPMFPEGEEFYFEGGLVLKNGETTTVEELPEGLEHPHLTVKESGKKTTAKKGGE